MADVSLAEVRRQSGGSGCLLVGAIFSGLGAILLLITLALILQQVRFRTGGVHTTANVVSLRDGVERRPGADDRNGRNDAVANHPELRKTYYATLGYTDEKGGMHTADVRLSQQEWRAGSFGIVYLRSNPDAMMLESRLRSPLMIVAFGAWAALVVPIGAGMLVSGVRGPRRRHRLLTQGVPVKGEVIGERFFGKRNALRQVRFAFTGPDGVRREAWSIYLPDRDAFPTGATITVYCDESQPTVFEADVFGAS